jgi:hypothetical protein
MDKVPSLGAAKTERRSTSPLDVMEQHVPSLGVVASRLALTVVGGLCLVGCFPYHYTLRPGVTGVVLDARTGSPVANATVAVRSRDFHGQIGEVTLATGADGKFHLAPEQRWGIYVVPMDVFGPWVDAAITAPSYETKTFKLTASAMGPREVALGEIRLTRDP